MAAQFVAALTDNALLIIAIARLQELSAADWTIPLLKLTFVLSYVFLAPLVGPLADTWRKGHVMLGANVLKVGAALLLAFGSHPLWALAMAGLGAAIYAPAKYGLICELLPAGNLVRANGFIEAGTVCAVIFGTVLGGVLVSPLITHTALATQLAHHMGTHTALFPALMMTVTLYGMAAVLNLWIADSGARYPRHSLNPLQLCCRFFEENRLLWRDPLGGLSMSVTTLLWGIGATLQLIVLRWAEEALGLTLDKAAYLQGISAVGVIAGAALASHTVSLTGAVKLLPLGIVLGLLVPTMTGITSLATAGALLVVVGGMAGFFVVPMNALLQHRGHSLLTAGRSIAVQGFNENAAILVMLALYAAATAAHLSLFGLIWCFGFLVVATMTRITVSYRRSAAAAIRK